MNATYYVYILFSPEFDKYYIGQTNDVQQRLVRHNKGLVLSTKAYLPWEVHFYLEKPSRSEAMILERKLKNLGRQRLQEFIQKYRSESRY